MKYTRQCNNGRDSVIGMVRICIIYMYILLGKISYIDGELETQACLSAEQKLLMISSMLAVKLASMASLNCIIEQGMC